MIVSDLVKPAFRVAGVTDRPGRTPATDQYAEALAILNRMTGSWNCDRLKIFTIAIAAYTFVTSKIAYTIGAAGGDFTAAAPQSIIAANIIFTGTPAYRSELHIMGPDEWAAVRLQTVPLTVPISIYPDYNFPLTKLYLWGQPIVGYQLELHTWRPVPTFTLITDTVELPPGYEKAIVYNLALEIAAQFPSQAHLAPDAGRIAGVALAAIESRNGPVPTLSNDAAGLGARESGSGSPDWWRTGGLA